MQQNAVPDDYNNALFLGPQLDAVAESNLPHIIDDRAGVVGQLYRKREPGTGNGSARPALWPFVPLSYVTQTPCHVFRGSINRYQHCGLPTRLDKSSFMLWLVTRNDLWVAVTSINFAPPHKGTTPPAAARDRQPRRQRIKNYSSKRHIRQLQAVTSFHRRGVRFY